MRTTVAIGVVVGIDLAPGRDVAAQTSATDPLVLELLRKLEERDAAIADLQERVNQLERRVDGATAPRSVAVRPEESPPAARTTAAAPPTPATRPRPQVAQTAEAPAAPASTAPAPGTVEVDEDAAERALERTLTEAGVLLLRPGRGEISPRIVYARREDRTSFNSVIDVDPTAGTNLQTFTFNRNVDRDEITGTVDLRVGLPWDSQVEVGVPFNFANVTREGSNAVTLAGGSGFSSSVSSESNSGIGFGDVSVGLAKTVVREDGWIPDVVARVTYDSATGRKSQNGVFLQGTPGFHDISTSVSIVKRQDPLAFVGGFGYTHTFEGNIQGSDFQPGDSFVFSLGAVLAASPETSVQFNFQQSFQNSDAVNGRKVDDSNTSSGVLSLGASTILARNVLLTASAGVGLGRNAPEYFFSLAIPIRFDTPF